MAVKKWLSFFLTLAMVLGLAPSARGDVLDIKAESAILMDASSGKILYAKNPDRRLPPASMTKLMTLFLAVESMDSGRTKPDERVTASENAWKLGGSQIYLEPGEEMSYRDMLISIAAGSANDACVAVAEHLDGSHEVFVERMNRKAKQINMKNTHFVNSYGLPDPKHLTSARDMAILGRYVLRNCPRVLEYTSIKEYDLRNGEFKLYNTNKLLWWYRGADGFKTGWTNEAKYCLVSTVNRDGLRLVGAVLGSPEPRGNFRDSMTMYNYGFARYAFKCFVPRGSICGLVKVGKGDRDVVEVIAAEDVGTICAKGDEKKLTWKKELNHYVDAPVKKGQVVGRATVYQGTSPVKKVNLIASQNVQRSSTWNFIKKMWREIFSI